MPPGGGGGERGCTDQDHPPAPVRLAGDAPPHSMQPLPAIAPVASKKKKQQRPAASLPEGPLAEILARVPYKSLCRFKCVSKPWLALCSSRDILRRSPQTLSGFFYHHTDHHSGEDTLSFRNLSGSGPPQVDPSLPFLRESYSFIYLVQVCGGLLLCVCFSSDKGDYVVCNPATEEWTALPPIQYPGQEFDGRLNAAIGFDAAVPSRYVVFASPTICGLDSGIVAIYSSETGQWSYVQSQWDSGTPVDPRGKILREKRHVFLNDTMHWPSIHKSIVTLDSEGKVWREIKMPDDLRKGTCGISFGRSQGSLYAWKRRPRTPELYIWVLEDYAIGKWILKHTVDVLELFRRHGRADVDSYAMFAIHPDCNVIFLTEEKMAMSYDLDNHKVDVMESMHGLPYTPCFAELSSASH
ncbi:unnamed protein product [Alopecurus aequalis]